MKLLTRLTLVILAAVQVPLWLVGGSVYLFEREQLESKLEQELQLIGAMSQRQLDEYLLQFDRDLKIIVESDHLKHGGKDTAAALAHHLNSFPKFDALILTRSNGEPIKHVGHVMLARGEISLQQAAASWVKTAISGARAIDRVTPAAGEIQRYLLYAQAIDSTGGERRWLFGQVNSEKIYALVSALQIGDSGRVTLFNHLGQLIGHPNKARYGHDMSAYPIMRNPVLRSIGDSGGIFVSGDGREKWGMTRMLTEARDQLGLHWGIIVDQTTDELYAPIRKLHNALLAGAIGGGLLFSLVGIWLAGHLLRPLRDIHNGLDSFFRFLNREAPAPSPLLTSGIHEYQQMAEAINRNIAVAATNIRQAREADTILHEHAAIYSSLLATSLDGFLRFDSDGCITDANQRYARMSGYSLGELLGMGIDQLDVGQSADVDLMAALYSRAREFGHDQFESLHRRKNGTTWAVEVSIGFRGDGIDEFHAFVRDITQRKNTEREIREMAFYDPLTQLPNRRLLADRFQSVLAACRRNKSCAAVMLLDLDNFKPLNDTHGHDAGDTLLVEVARRIRHRVREIDTVARLGGDEFVVLLHPFNCDLEDSCQQALAIAEKVRAALADPYVLELDGKTVEHHCSASIGVAAVEDDSSLDDALSRADGAMYAAKTQGRNRVAVCH